MSTDPTDEEKRAHNVEMVDKHVNQLAEHFDTVQIFVCRNDGENDRTLTTHRGSGNWFTRFGQVREWLIYEEERMREAARKRMKED